MLASDAEHGEHNRAVMQGWLDKWVPLSRRAALELQPIWSQPADKAVTFADSYGAATADFQTLITDLGLVTAKEQ
jgi:propane monooxygenase small subunit